MIKKIIVGIVIISCFIVSFSAIKKWRSTHPPQQETCVEFQRIAHNIQYTLGTITPTSGLYTEKMFSLTWGIIDFFQKLYNITEYDNNRGSCQKITQDFYQTTKICSEWIYRNHLLSIQDKQRKTLQCILDNTENNIITDSGQLSYNLQQEAIQEDKKIGNTENNTTLGCIKQSEQEYLSNKKCLEKIQKKNLTGVNIYNAIDQCFTYRDTIDYGSKNICYSTYRRNDTLYNICVENIQKNILFENMGDPLVMLQFRIGIAECMSKLIFRKESFSELSQEIGAASSYQVCTYETDCLEQELCNRNMTMRCEKSNNRLLSLQELQPIIKNNIFTEQGCAHNGGCSITTESGVSYYYKHIISPLVNELLKENNKKIQSHRIE